MHSVLNLPRREGHARSMQRTGTGLQHLSHRLAADTIISCLPQLFGTFPRLGIPQSHRPVRVGMSVGLLPIMAQLYSQGTPPPPSLRQRSQPLERPGRIWAPEGQRPRNDEVRSSRQHHLDRNPKLGGYQSPGVIHRLLGTRRGCACDTALHSKPAGVAA